MTSTRDSKDSISLEKILDTFKSEYKSDPIALVNKIPPNEIWRFFIDGLRQNKSKETRDALLKAGVPEEDFSLSVEQFIKKYPSYKFIFLDYCKKNKITDLSTPVETIFGRNKGWLPFELTEPGYLLGLINAYQHLFDFSKKLPDLVKSLHSLAIAEVKETLFDSHASEKKGEFRSTNYISFPLSSVNTTAKGFEEFLYKIKNTGIASHFFVITLEDHENGILTHIISDDLKESEAATQSISRLLHKARMYQKFLAVTDAIEDQKSLFGDYVSDSHDRHKQAKCFSIAASPEASEKMISILNTTLENLIDQYHQSINQAKSPYEKLTAIVSFIRDCEQMHPFLDGNTRTFSMLLMNHLLMRNHFPPTIVDDPNRSGGYSVSELTQEVIKGMQRSIDLSQGKPIYEVSTKDILPYLTSSEKNYFDSVIKIEIEGRKQRTIKTASGIFTKEAVVTAEEPTQTENKEHHEKKRV